MFLTSLTLRGFKSFADRATLAIEPGITVIVGPNGSGKSNVVDALAWVLGTTSPSKVRGGAMADVIFAGSPGRAAATTARVEITIDNSAGQLGSAGLGTAGSAQGFDEVRVARTIDPSGEGGYEINGQEVRALDVQELLSDTGLGRELHTIVGQGQLDAILDARPEDRRRYIEEAAGILKHRRRRERALRKLEHVEDHTDKLQGILRELRRQLRPLERQAEAADRHRALQAELRQVRMTIAAHDLGALRAESARLERRDAEAVAAVDAAQRDAESAADRIRELTTTVEAVEARLGDARRTDHQLDALGERLRGLVELVVARRRHLTEVTEEPLAGRPPDELRSRAADCDAAAQRWRVELDRAAASSREATRAREQTEQARRDHAAAVERARRRQAAHREDLVRWEGQVAALRGAIAAADDRLRGADEERGRVAGRLAELDEEMARARTRAAQLERAEIDLTTAFDAATTEASRLRAELEGHERELEDAERRRDAERARAEALWSASPGRTGAVAALLDTDEVELIGPLARFVRVEPSAEAALGAALGSLAEAVVAPSRAAAASAVAWLRDADLGCADVVAVADRVERPAIGGPASAVAVGSLLAPATDEPDAPAVLAAVRDVLRHTFLVDDWDAAVRASAASPHLTFVTAAGERAGPVGFAGGRRGRSAVALATAAEAAEERARRADEEVERIAAACAAHERRLAEAVAAVAAAEDRLHRSDAAITAAAEGLAALHAERQSLADRREQLRRTHEDLRRSQERDRTALGALLARRPEADEDDALADEEVLSALDARVERCRQREFDARSAAARAADRLEHATAEAERLRQEADAVEEALAAAERRRRRRREGIRRCAELVDCGRRAVGAVERSRDEVRSRIDEDATTLATARGQLEAAAAARERTLDVVTTARQRRHDADLRRADLERRVEALATRVRTVLGLELDDLGAADPPSGGDRSPPLDRSELEEREETLVRRIGLLGRVNPLALEEFRALEERHDFLSRQLDDLRRSRRDLERLIEAVDGRVARIFGEAFADVAAEFERLFARLFPGGRGRLVLTDPADLLTTGIEVEARVPGTKVDRLSLLSGGERSLTVLAFVFAIFHARPSPFYVLDEVDAALDDVNLQRLLRVIADFRGRSQIIMVTHQKRSMELADTLYGITMSGDATTKVVAQRLGDGAGDEHPVAVRPDRPAAHREASASAGTAAADAVRVGVASTG